MAYLADHGAVLHVAQSGSEGSSVPRTVLIVVVRELKRRSVAPAVGQRVRHPLRWGGRPLDVWKADWSGARRGTELDAVDLDIVAFTRAFEHVVERAASVPERISPVGNDDRRLELHTRSIARLRPDRGRVAFSCSIASEGH